MIPFDAICRALEACTQLPADDEGAGVSVRIDKIRCEGKASDFAHGVISVTLPTEVGPVVVTSGWSAWGQPRIELGWYVERVPDRPGEGIEIASRVFELDEVGEINFLSPTGEELAGLAWEFWSWRDLEDAVTSRLPAC